MMRELLSADFLKFFIPLLGAIIAWFVNERRRRVSEEYLRKEERYRELLRSMRGFYEHSGDVEDAKQFIEEYRKCWLYCDDAVILAANDALDALKKGTTLSMDKRQSILGHLVLTLRRDLLSRKLTKRTALQSKDFMHIAA